MKDTYLFEQVLERNLKLLKLKTVAKILCGLSIAAPLIGFWLAAIIGDPIIFGVLGILRYSWIVYLFAVIPIACLGLGIFLKANGLVFFRAFNVPIICIVVILVLGSFGFVFPASYELDSIEAVEEKTGVDFPSNLKAITDERENYTVIYAKILDKAEKAEFEKSLDKDSVWEESLGKPLKDTIPGEMLFIITDCDYHVYFNATLGKFNFINNDGLNDIVLIGYEIQNGRFIILTDFVFKDK